LTFVAILIQILITKNNISTICYSNIDYKWKQDISIYMERHLIYTPNIKAVIKIAIEIKRQMPHLGINKNILYNIYIDILLQCKYICIK
jgi:hypothetical protein